LLHYNFKLKYNGELKIHKQFITNLENFYLVASCGQRGITF